MGSADAAQLTTMYVSYFDRWLKGDEKALSHLAPVRLFVMGIDEWRDEQQWPPHDVVHVEYYLAGSRAANTAAGDGQLETAAPSGAAVDSFVYDPRDPVPSVGGINMLLADFNGLAGQREVEARQDVLVYSVPVLTEAVEVTACHPVATRILSD